MTIQSLSEGTANTSVLGKKFHLDRGEQEGGGGRGEGDKSEGVWREV